MNRRVCRCDFDPIQKLEKLQQKKKLEHQLVSHECFEHLHDGQADPNNQVSEDGYPPNEMVIEVSFFYLQVPKKLTTM